VYKVEKEPVTSEEENKDESSENGEGKMSEWFTENLRMIVSVVIVVVIAGGIYSYSKRAQAPNMNKSAVSTEENSEGKISVIGGDNQTAATDQQAAPEAANDQKNQTSENVQAPETQTSQETETSFVETAAKGDGSTILARRAVANYLEKNPDSSLTAEHKVYIEDLLRRQVKDGRMKIGDKREFTKDMIAKAIEKSKSLNEKQLKNLQKYSHRVSAWK
jgi:polyhydroxyalkanoate synthesis regulator phasin